MRAMARTILGGAYIILIELVSFSVAPTAPLCSGTGPANCNNACCNWDDEDTQCKVNQEDRNCCLIGCRQCLGDEPGMSPDACLFGYDESQPEDFGTFDCQAACPRAWDCLDGCRQCRNVPNDPLRTTSGRTCYEFPDTVDCDDECTGGDDDGEESGTCSVFGLLGSHLVCPAPPPSNPDCGDGPSRYADGQRSHNPNCSTGPPVHFVIFGLLFSFAFFTVWNIVQARHLLTGVIIAMHKGVNSRCWSVVPPNGKCAVVFPIWLIGVILPLVLWGAIGIPMIVPQYTFLFLRMKTEYSRSGTFGTYTIFGLGLGGRGGLRAIEGAGPPQQIATPPVVMGTQAAPEGSP